MGGYLRRTMCRTSRYLQSLKTTEQQRLLLSKLEQLEAREPLSRLRCRWCRPHLHRLRWLSSAPQHFSSALQKAKNLGLSPPASPLPDAESFHKSSHVAKPTDTVRAASLNVRALLLLARAASRLHHARPPFFLPCGVSRSFLSPLRSFLSPPSLSCPTRNR